MTKFLKKVLNNIILRKDILINNLKNCPTPTRLSSSEIDDMRKMIARDFIETKKGEEVKIVTGECETEIWGYPIVKNSILYAIDKGAKIRIIVSPVLESKYGYNFLLEQALLPNSSIEAYIAPRRELTHYRIHGSRKMYIQKYYEPLAQWENREGKYILNDSFYPNITNPLGVFTIQKYQKDFEAIIKVYKLKQIKDKNEVLLLEKKDLEKIIEHAKKRKLFFDDYEREELEKALVA